MGCADIPSCRWGHGHRWDRSGRQGASDVVPFRTRTLRTVLVALGLSVAGAAVPAVASASIALGTVVSANPANFTPNVASGAVYKFVQVGPTMYAGGAFSSVSTPAGVSPGGTFARSNLVAFNAATGVISSFAPSVNGEVWAGASNGTSRGFVGA